MSNSTPPDLKALMYYTGLAGTYKTLIECLAAFAEEARDTGNTLGARQYDAQANILRSIQTLTHQD